MSILKSINPATEELFAEFKEIDLSATKQIIKASSGTQEGWARLSIDDRISVFIGIAKSLLDSSAEHAKIITAEMGKPIAEATAEIEKCAWLCEYYAENSMEFLKDKYCEKIF